MNEIRVSAVVLRRANGDVLLVRKRGTDAFMNPGGKPEPGEDARTCAVREVGEELGLTLDPAHLTPLGQFVAPAANESGFDVRADCFLHEQPVPDAVTPAAEIEEAIWVRLDTPTGELPIAPLFTDRLLPLLR